MDTLEPLQVDEQRLLEIYRRLAPEMKHAALMTIGEMLSGTQINYTPQKTVINYGEVHTQNNYGNIRVQKNALRCSDE